jgi:hypothetical protein
MAAQMELCCAENAALLLQNLTMSNAGLRGVGRCFRSRRNLFNRRSKSRGNSTCLKDAVRAEAFLHPPDSVQRQQRCT